MGSFGIWTIVPTLIVVVVALISKKTVESLFIGFIATYILISAFTGQPFLTVLDEAFFKTVTDKENLWVVIVVFLFGSFGELLSASKGPHAISAAINRRCKTNKGIGVFTWLLGILLFIDDYLNIMTVSTCMKGAFDERKMPRESLAYIIDSTGVCAVVLIPFSTWAMFYSTNFYAHDAVKALGFGSAINTYYRIIPYMFYAFCSLLLVFLFAVKVVPTFGPMKKAFESYEPKKDTSSDTAKNDGHIIDILLPIAVMIVVTLIVDDMLIALLAAIFSCLALYIPRRVMTIGRFCDTWVSGMQTMVPTILVLVFSFLMKQACIDINLPSYAVEKTLPFISAGTFPAVAFILVGVLSFMTGNGWSAPALCIPVVIPMASACGANLILTMAAIVSGGVLCGHICFYSDLALLTSQACEVDTMTHVKTQLPYSMLAFSVSIVLFLVFGLVGL